ncbi:PAS/PAC sensor hybrid histidine kinase [Caballeronia cordobensis]|uniref:histidine kinase n=1 Tax=Caballeronia cordobensis TaxID=1353886 RepID=A0A158JU72_CABCO|nr:ATP-binding protein [Caballeronia cordobensis]SAL72367.1 PAS/PAC sensor hybrid histidine kinase [Caballeronia cordobensis]
MDSQNPVPDEHLQLIVEATPTPMLILWPDDAFTIAGVTDAYLKETLTVRNEIVGRALFDVFPDNPAAPEADATTNLHASLKYVVATKKPHTMAIQRYDVPDRDRGGFAFRYWSPVNAPVIARDGRLLYVLHRVENVTEFMLSQKANEALREQSRALTAELGRSEAEASRRGAALDLTTNALQRMTEDAQAWRLGEEKFRMVTDALPQMVWTARADGQLDYHNQHFYDFSGAAQRAAEGQDWKNFVHPEDLASAEQAWSRSVAAKEPYEAMFRVRHRSGEYRWTLARAALVRDTQADMLKWVGSNTDIHEKVLAEQELREAHQRKDEFLAMLAHELRNPLVPIRAGAELLPELSTDPAQVDRVGTMIRRQIVHVMSLIDDLLEVSRVTQGLIALDKRNIDFRQVVEDSVEQVRPLIDVRRHRLTVDMPDKVVCVLGDHNRLVQVLSNLLNNAAKYTPDGGRIELSVRCSSGSVVTTVRDNGIGMESELLRTAFDLFQQGQRTSERKEGGLGLGLALVKSMVEQHGGNVVATSAGRGSGSTLEVRLPLMLGETQAAPANLAFEQPPIKHKRRRVLLVDDNVEVAEALGMVLDIMGNEVAIEHDAPGALARAKKETFDICVLDIGLPSMGGYELARHLRASPGSQGAVFVAHTGYGQEEDRIKSEAAGFAHHLVKPVGIHDLQNILNHGGH